MRSLISYYTAVLDNQIGPPNYAHWGAVAEELVLLYYILGYWSMHKYALMIRFVLQMCLQGLTREPRLKNLTKRSHNLVKWLMVIRGSHMPCSFGFHCFNFM